MGMIDLVEHLSCELCMLHALELDSCSMHAAIYHTGVRRRLPLPAEPGDRARDLRCHLPDRGSGHLLGGGRLLRLLQVTLHPFGDQEDRRHRLRRFLMVSTDY